MRRKKTILAALALILLAVIVYLAFTALARQEWLRGLEEDGKRALAYNHPQEATQYFEVVLRHRPNDEKIRNYLYSAYIKSNEYDLALQLAEKTLRSRWLTLNEKLEWETAKTSAFYARGDLESAEQWAKGLIESYPASPNGYMLMAGIYQKRGEHNRVIEYSKRALDLLNQPQHRFIADQAKIALRAELAYAYLSLDEYDDAESVIDEGLLFAATTRKREHAKVVSKPSPDRPLVALRAVIQEIHGKHDAARETWQQVLDLGHGNKDTLSNLAHQRLDTTARDGKAQLPPPDVLLEQFD